MKNLLRLTSLCILSVTLHSSCTGDDPAPEPEYCSDSILSAPYNSGLTAYYKFVNGSVNDLSGNNHHGTITGTVIPAENPSGTLNCAMRFPGTETDYIAINSHTDFDFDETTPMSIVLWFKPEYTLGVLSDYQLLIGRDPGTGLRCPDTYGEYSLGLHDCSVPVFGLGTSRAWDKSYSADLPPYCDSLKVYFKNEGWQSLIAVYDPSEISYKWKIYRNGVETTDTGSICSIPYSIAYDGDIIIGKNYHGDIDDIKIYNRILSHTEIDFLKSYISPCCE